MPKKIFTTKEGFNIMEVDDSLIGINDVLVEVISSFYSPGTEQASAKKISESIIKKSFRFKDQIIELIKQGDFSTLAKKIKNQQNTKLTTGYSIFGKVLSIGQNVKKLRHGQYVVCLGERASHGSIAVVPQGMVFSCDYNIDYSCISLLSIALNSTIIGNFKPFSKILVLGGGLLGQFIIQILNNFGHDVSVVELRDELKVISTKNGAKNFFKLGDYVFHKGEFEGVISTLPNLSKSMWNMVTEMVKISSNFVLVGASDINISRSIFYSKRLNFITAYSYGSGRGEFEYEQLSNHETININSGPTIKDLVIKGLKLIDDKKVNIDFVEKIDLSDKTGNIDDVINNKTLGFNFIWESKFDNSVTAKKSIIDSENLNNKKFKGFDIVGDSAFFRDSHQPALKSLKVQIGTLKTRSPKTKNNIDKKLDTNSVIISTPHIEHWNNIVKSNYKYIFVDKPIITSKKEFIEYVKSKKSIVCLMNRRYSLYTELLKSFVQKNPKKTVLNLSFNVPEKSSEDPIYFSGGRLIGEMCHHVDLALCLLGPARNFKKIIVDDNVDAQRSENCKIVINHMSGAISKISYSTDISPFWNKEAIWATVNDQFLFVRDFKSIKSNNGKTQELHEKDKGCFNMWKNIVGKLNSNENFQDFIDLDRQTYSIISQILYK